MEDLTVLEWMISKEDREAKKMSMYDDVEDLISFIQKYENVPIPNLDEFNQGILDYHEKFTIKNFYHFFNVSFFNTYRMPKQ